MEIASHPLNHRIVRFYDSNHDSNNHARNYYDIRKLVPRLGIVQQKIDCCESGCMIHYKDDENLQSCKFCGTPRYKAVPGERAKGEEVPRKRNAYLPLIPRLKRLYASMSSVPHMRWHHENRRLPGVMCHPSYGNAWKDFIHRHPDFERCPKFASHRTPGYGVTHNWTKRNILWDLSYWRENLIRHNLDAMHIEKNIFENIFNTIMDILGKTKNNVKARMDLQEYCVRCKLHLQKTNQDKWVKTNAKYIFTTHQRRSACEWVKALWMPDGYASNMARYLGKIKRTVKQRAQVEGRPSRKSDKRCLNEANYFTESCNGAGENLYFEEWFKSYVLNLMNGITSEVMKDLAWGPNKKVQTWPKYFVNGFKFHTQEWSKEKKTVNSDSAIWIKGEEGNDGHQRDF
ncbi:hypothetical protein CRG98_048501 [Punica granatum]|uniref:Uncharacterized protein n=1 Tax=Punica granatum TaxID=22663 RepID=A0A2I0HHE3_PUNGR|nr:hypothetical protein CRG98_048501 [Punica granatum]